MEGVFLLSSGEQGIQDPSEVVGDNEARLTRRRNRTRKVCSLR